ncbi:hypothetical protein E3P92_02833 [Wallemia ichthyophaga]|nr:hypothetical protein E3P92_02833 [Wallemia ichthyophaga]
MPSSTLPPLNWLVSPPQSTETSPTNPETNQTSHDQLSVPIQPDELTEQLDLWANVKFDFDSPDNAAGGQLASLDDEYANALTFDTDQKPQIKRQKYDLDAALAGVVGAGGAGGAQANSAPASSVPSLLPQSEPTLETISALLKEAPSAPLLSNSTTNNAHEEDDDDEHNDEDKVVRRRRFKKLPMPPVQQRDGESYDQAKKRTEKEHREAETAAKKELEEDKRRRNTAASARFRVKKKAREAALEQETNEYKGRLEQAERAVSDLKRENGWLRGLIINSNRA